jgi:periplasmic protein CpxP/Spy
MTRLRTPFLAAALLTGVAAVGLTPALAQTAPTPENPGAAPAEARHHHAARMLPGRLIEGRIAFLKAELKITPAQEAQWQQVAAAMRENAKTLDQAIPANRQNRGDMNAVQRLEAREQFAKLRAENDARLLAAFKPLYAGLSPEQQQMANELMLMGPRHHHGWHHRA